jgi:hypothetical protein
MSVKGLRHWIVNIDRLAGTMLVAACCVLLPAKSWANPTEAELRAAVIVAIMRFTTWPSTETLVPSNLFVCLSGEPNSASHLLRVSGDQKVAGRVLQVKNLPGPDITSCQVLVLGAGLSREDLATRLQASDKHSILTVCDGCENSRQEDTIIYLTLRKQRVNFEVNLAKAKSNGLALDAQLLELASVVRK